MCEHCRRDMTQFDWTVLPDGVDMRAFHDGWLFPHGRAGYGVTHEQVAAAQAKCPFCAGNALVVGT
jgi:hypothetical protein